eukprot:2326182-Lingulodinium_polyedra.AAC.1
MVPGSSEGSWRRPPRCDAPHSGRVAMPATVIGRAARRQAGAGRGAVSPVLPHPGGGQRGQANETCPR